MSKAPTTGTDKTPAQYVAEHGGDLTAAAIAWGADMDAAFPMSNKTVTRTRSTVWPNVVRVTVHDADADVNYINHIVIVPETDEVIARVFPFDIKQAELPEDLLDRSEAYQKWYANFHPDPLIAWVEKKEAK